LLPILAAAIVGAYFFKVAVPDYLTPTPIPTPAPDYAGTVHSYRDAERAARLTLSDAVMAQLPVFASGAALVLVENDIQTLQNANRYQRLTVEEFAINQAIVDSPTVVKLLADETHRLQTYERQATGDTLVDDQHFEAQIAYQLVNDGQRWRVDQVGFANRKEIP